MWEKPGTKESRALFYLYNVRNQEIPFCAVGSEGRGRPCAGQTVREHEVGLCGPWSFHAS